MEKFICFSRQEKTCLKKLKLSYRECATRTSNVTRWIDFAATPKLEYLDFECYPWSRSRLQVVPLSLFICEKLSYLRLHGVLLEGFECVSLPCVKTMCLEENIYANKASLELLISSCPSLEYLSIVRKLHDNVRVLRVESQTLTSLSVKLGVDDYHKDRKRGILVDAPVLKYLYLDDVLYLSKTRINASSLTKVNLLSYFTGSDEKVCNFFNSISGVADMNISWYAFELIVRIMPFSPRFCNLTRLETKPSYDSLKKLPKFLECCPNLKSLKLDLYIHSSAEQTRFLFVPQCLMSSLEFVEIRCIFTWNPMVIEVARYFAENSTILKELSLLMRSSLLEENAAVLGDILALPTRSTTCRISVVNC